MADRIGDGKLTKQGRIAQALSTLATKVRLRSHVRQALTKARLGTPEGGACLTVRMLDPTDPCPFGDRLTDTWLVGTLRLMPRIALVITRQIPLF